jgi:anti-sigma factor RsiW
LTENFAIKMDHRQHIEPYLSAYLDDELGTEERRAAEAHLASCAECRERLVAERAAKALLQKGFPIIAAPAALRERISAALDAIDRAQPRARVRVFRRPRLWMAVGGSLAACLAMLVVNFSLRETANPMFDPAVASFLESEKDFSPNVGSRSTDALAVALIEQFGVAPIWDFSSLGLVSAGGRIDHTADGKAVAYMLYKGAQGSLLCKIDREEVFHFPSGGRVVKGVHIYRYKGFSIAATNRYAVFCVMVTRLPVAQVARAFDQLPT